MNTRQLSLFLDDDSLQSVRLQEKLVNFKMRANYRIRRTRLVVTPEEGLVVETPHAPTRQKALDVIHKKSTWVLDALKSVEKKQETAQHVKKAKESILIFGKEKLIKIKQNQSRNFTLETANHIYVGFNTPRVKNQQVRERLSEWLKERAKKYIPLRVKHVNQGRFKYKKVIIKDHKTLWGSCSSEGNLNFNWRLIMAPQEVSDYIFIHELCHTRHLNHSNRYWKLVETVMPHYTTPEKWLKDYGFVLGV